MRTFADKTPLFNVAHRVDEWILAILTPLAVYLAASGLDDFFLDAAWIVTWLRGRRVVRAPTHEQLAGPERRIAIFVPLWHEHNVIGPMVAHNIAALRYPGYDFFVGAYPNDQPTMAAVGEVEARFSNVHLAVCPHDGPTSKADCLNWIYQNMIAYEEREQCRFELVLTHDAEDIMHPESLRWMNHFAGDYDFIQIPVLALKTPLLNLTHGMYCDEFAEFQTRDLPVRNRLGGFVPSAGVGTAYTRRALEALALTEANCIFEPSSLTEDYENGRRLHDLGFAQVFVPPLRSGDSFVATREYFPRNWHAAIRQRTRWVMGIALQGWENHGWTGGWRQRYWLWRDRKGLIGSPLSVLTNLLTIYGFATRMWERVHPTTLILVLCWLTLISQIVRTGVRVVCVGRIYGWRFASLVPVRALFANGINCSATIRAVFRYTKARLRNEPLVWLKTSHSYPSIAALAEHRRKLGEILVGSAYVDQADMERALATQPAGVRIGEHLIALRLLTEEELYEALSLQQGLPLGAPAHVARRVARSLPAHVLRQWRILPFQVASGRMYVAAPEIPTEELHATLRNYTSLEIRFHLVTPSAFRELEKQIA
jgi:bacteriophage N4 adsorption protein B